MSGGGAEGDEGRSPEGTSKGGYETSSIKLIRGRRYDSSTTSIGSKTSNNQTRTSGGVNGSELYDSPTRTGDVGDGRETKRRSRGTQYDGGRITEKTNDGTRSKTSKT